MTRATALALKLALVTGQRTGEVVGITPSELSLDEAAPIWVIPGPRTKNRQGNRVPLSGLAVQLIKEAQALSDGHPWLFPNPKRTFHIAAHAISKALARSREAIGIEDFRAHDLRRTAATRMAEIGVSPHTISLILNHVSATRGSVTSRVYVQYSYDREKAEALTKWSEYLEQLLSTHNGTIVGNRSQPTGI